MRRELDVSVGTLSVMHPVDWMQVNMKNGLGNQPLPECHNEDHSAWFLQTDLSFLKTPQKAAADRSSLDADPDTQTVKKPQKNADAYVSHSVGTMLSFDVGVDVQTKLAGLLQWMTGKQLMTCEKESIVVEETTVEQTPGNRTCGDDLLVPFSSIKKSMDRCRPLAKSKRSLFVAENHDAHRFSLDDDEDSDEDHHHHRLHHETTYEHESNNQHDLTNSENVPPMAL